MIKCITIDDTKIWTPLFCISFVEKKIQRLWEAVLKTLKTAQKFKNDKISKRVLMKALKGRG